MPMNTRIQDCIDDCQNCEEVCLETITHCLEMGKDYADPEQVNLLITCAEVCATNAKLMSIDSPFHVKIVRVGAEICDACAEFCEEFEDDLMTRCAVRCRACADSCREVASVRVPVTNRPRNVSYQRPWA